MLAPTSARVSQMDKQERLDKAMALVNTIAMHAIELPPEERVAVVRESVDELRRQYRSQYRAQAERLRVSLEYAAKVEELALALVRVIEHSGGVIGNA